MPKSKFAARLSQMQSEWDDSQNQYDTMFGGVVVSEQIAEARLQSASLRESASSGKLMVKREHLLTSGPQQGSVVYDYMQLETNNGPTFLRRWFDMMGYESPADPADIEGLIEDISNEGAAVKIQIKHSPNANDPENPFINVRVIGLLDQEEAEEGAEEAEEVESEEAVNGDLLAELLNICEKHGVDVSEVDTEDFDAVVSLLSEYSWPATQLDAEEIASLQAADIVVDGDEDAEQEEAEEEAEEAEEVESEEDQAIYDSLVAFCEAQGVDIAEDDTIDVLKERICDYEWPEEDMTEEEVELFTSAGIDSAIKKKPVKKPATSKKTAQKKVASTQKKTAAKKSTQTKTAQKKTAQKKASRKKSR